MIASKEEEVMEALRSVIDPEIGLNVVELGLIRNLTFNSNHEVKITMILTTPVLSLWPPAYSTSAPGGERYYRRRDAGGNWHRIVGPVYDGRRRRRGLGVVLEGRK